MNREIVSESSCFKIVYWFGIGVGVVIPALYGYFNAKQVKLFDQNQDSKELEFFCIVTAVSVQIIIFLIGFFMVICLLVVNKNIGKLPESQSINLKTLLVHAGAFVLFTLAGLVQAVMFTLYVINSTPKTLNNNLIADIACNFLNLISGCCIFYVFWQLGDAESLDVTRDTDTSINSIETHEFD